MVDSTLINQFLPNTEEFINHQAKVADFITSSKHLNLSNLTNILPVSVIEKILLIPILVNDIKNKIVWKYINDGEFSIKTVSWTNNEVVRPYPKAKLGHSEVKFNTKS